MRESSNSAALDSNTIDKHHDPAANVVDAISKTLDNFINQDAIVSTGKDQDGQQAP